MNNSASIKALAKLNLFLHINCKQNNGYHHLQSLVAFTYDIYDELQIKPAKQNSLSIDGEFADKLLNKPNLIQKLLSLIEIYDDQLMLDIKLIKKLPISAGIGGGSSDAASLLNFINQHYRFDLTIIKEICQKLGADLLTCYYSQANYIQGITQQVKLLSKLPKIYAVLVNPKIELSTELVFKNHQGPYTCIEDYLPECFDNIDQLINFLLAKQNDLQYTAIKLLPLIQDVLITINKQANCLLSRLSGSGATCFGLFLNFSAANQASINIKLEQPNWWVASSLLI